VRRWYPVSVVPLIFALSACMGIGDNEAASSSSSPSATRGEVEAIDGLSGYAQQLEQSGRIRIGVRYDTPGIGYLAAGESTPSGFDVEVGKILAGGLGIKPSDIQWVQTLTSSREQVLQTNTVDLVVATYTMTAARQELVGMAGPYYITGAQLLVRSSDQATFANLDPGPNGNPRLRGLPASLNNKVCTSTESPTQSVVQNEFKLTPVVKASIGDCVSLLQQGSVAAVATDGAIEIGYAHASGGALSVVEDPFTEEKYGVGYQIGAAGMCDYVQKTLLRAYKDGSWLGAFTDTLGKSGVQSPEPPAFEPC
jgi:glutamate transport system substrate-binding protein